MSFARCTVMLSTPCTVAKVTRLLCQLGLVLLAIYVTCSPAFAAAPKFTHCSVTDRALQKGTTIIRTNAPDGQQIFQNSLALPVMKSGDKKLRAYLVWPDGNYGGSPKLWIVHESFVHEGIVSPGAQLRMQSVGAKKATQVAMGRQLSRGDFEIFEIDPAELESQFAGVESLKLHIVDVSDPPRLPSRYAPGEMLNLAALKTEVQVHRSAAQSSDCTPTTVDVPIEVNANEYSECDQISRGELGHISVGAQRFQWQYPLGPSLYLNADRYRFNEERDDAFLASIEKPFVRPHGPLTFRTNLFEKGRTVEMTVVMTADTVRYDVRTKQGEAVLERDALMRLDATGAPIHMVATDTKGKVRLDSTHPANLFTRATAGLIEARGKLVEAQKNPMKNCAPEQSIIVTSGV